MRIVRTALIAAVASAALAGAALAARDDDRLMLVALPDGSVEHIRLQTTAPPPVVIVPVHAPVPFLDVAFGPGSPFAEMERISMAMEARAAALMRQAATAREYAPAGGPGIVMTNAAGQPVGVMHYSYVSSTTSADGCTQTVRISSNGTGQQPQVIRTSAGDCAAAKARPAPAIAPSAGPTAPVTPVKARPAANPGPKITPVSAPKPLPEFTPSYII